MEEFLEQLNPNPLHPIYKILGWLFIFFIVLWALDFDMDKIIKFIGIIFICILLDKIIKGYIDYSKQ